MDGAIASVIQDAESVGKSSPSHSLTGSGYIAQLLT